MPVRPLHERLIVQRLEDGDLPCDEVEVTERLPSERSSSDEHGDLFNAFGREGIEVVDPDQEDRDDKGVDRTAEAAGELDLAPGAFDKTNDPVRLYMREMGTIPLLTREGEVEIARRIERGT